MTKAKVLLISPTEAGSGVRVGFPLGLGILANVVRGSGREVSMIDTAFTPLDERALKDFNPDVVGISTNTVTYPNGLKYAYMVKRVLGNKCAVWIGGPHTTNAGWATLIYNPVVDLAFYREAEDSILEALDRLESREPMKEIPGTYYRTKTDWFNGTLEVKLKERPFIEDLDKIPFPARELLDADNYPLEIFPGKKAATLITSRGCPGRCIFCSSNENWGRKFRYRSVENVIQELTQLRGEGYEVLHFEDDILTANMTRAKELFDSMTKSGFGFEWSCETRADRVDKELLDHMYKSGCRFIFYGVESGVQEILDKAGKGETLDTIVKAFRMTQDAGIQAHASIQFGLPGETKETVHQTLDWIEKELKPDSVELHLTTLYPGSPLSLEYGLRGDFFESRGEGEANFRLINYATWRDINDERNRMADPQYPLAEKQFVTIKHNSDKVRKGKYSLFGYGGHGVAAPLLSPNLTRKILKSAEKHIKNSKFLVYASGFCASSN